MFLPKDYELLDFGLGRKLERFGDFVLDRPCVAAQQHRPASPDAWKSAAARFELSGADCGSWKLSDPLPATWTVWHGSVAFELRRTAAGQVGLFAEQAENWDWIRHQVERTARAVRVLNLFAYTGGSTLAAAEAGANVVHVDAARNVVAWARRNAAHSGLSGAPIRWIAEDAYKFVQRELRRANHYDAVILDPPSYGHGPQGEPWQLRKDLMPLLCACRQLIEPRPAFVLLTCHSPGYGPEELSTCVSEAMLGGARAGLVARPLMLCTADGRPLPAGVVARWSP